MDEGRLALAGAARRGRDDSRRGATWPRASRRCTAGRGADVAFEAVGAAEPIATAVRRLRKGGALMLVGNVTPKVELPLQAIVTRELTLLRLLRLERRVPGVPRAARRAARCASTP